MSNYSCRKLQPAVASVPLHSLSTVQGWQEIAQSVVQQLEQEGGQEMERAGQRGADGAALMTSHETGRSS